MRTETEKMPSGELYDADDPELVAERERARAVTRRFNRVDADDRAERRRLLGSSGEEWYVEPPFRCDYGYDIHVGESFYANFGRVVLDVCRVEIGRNCLVGPGVHVYTATRPLDMDERSEGLEYGKPVTVGDDVWIGGRAVINPGVTVGDGAVVASGAVVTEDVPDGVVVRGNPATVARRLNPDRGHDPRSDARFVPAPATSGHAPDRRRGAEPGRGRGRRAGRFDAGPPVSYRTEGFIDPGVPGRSSAPIRPYSASRSRDEPSS